jgi:type II secretory pathway component GspD/PulD (secretin)
MNAIVNAAVIAALCQPLGTAPAHTRVEFDVLILTVPAEDTPAGAKTDEGGVAVLSDEQFRGMLDGGRGPGARRSPKVVAPDGEAARVRVGTRREFVTGLDAAVVDGKAALVPRRTAVELGHTLVLRGRASADRRRLAVDVGYTNRRLAGGVETIPVTAKGIGGKGEATQRLQAADVRTVSVEKTGLVLPSGGHVVITGPVEEVVQASVARTPVLSDLPVVGRMFTSIGYTNTSVRTFVVVTARVEQVEK